MAESDQKGVDMWTCAVTRLIAAVSDPNCRVQRSTTPILEPQEISIALGTRRSGVFNASQSLMISGILEQGLYTPLEEAVPKGFSCR